MIKGDADPSATGLELGDCDLARGCAVRRPPSKDAPKTTSTTRTAALDNPMAPFREKRAFFGMSGPGVGSTACAATTAVPQAEQKRPPTRKLAPQLVQKAGGGTGGWGGSALTAAA